MKGGKPGLNVRPRLKATYAAFKKAGKDKEIKGKVIPFDHEVARMEREMTNLESTTKEKTHGNYRTSTSYDEKGSTSDLSLYSEDRVLQLENEKERNRSVKL